MRKPEVGDYYIIYAPHGFSPQNIIEIIRVKGNKADFITLDGSTAHWDFNKFPDGVNRKLSSLEVELL